MDRTIAVLVSVDRATPPPAPERRPIGRAALALAAEGIGVVFGDRARGGRVWGFVARPGRWEPLDGAPVQGAYDRFLTALSRPREYAVLVTALGPIPIANPSGLIDLMRDKVATQRLLEDAGLDLPEIETDPDRFADRLAGWGRAFLKPRYGSFGRGVRAVRAGDSLRLAHDARPEDGAPILQRAVPPPRGWCGVSVRVSAQRLAGGTWHANPPVARTSRQDPVVNAGRGSEVRPADEVLSNDTLSAIEGIVNTACATLARQPDGERLAEVGVDLVIDDDGRPWPVEVNSRPQGRLRVLADHHRERFEGVHLEACLRPLRYVAWLADQRGPQSVQSVPSSHTE